MNKLDILLLCSVAFAAYALGIFTMALRQYWEGELEKPIPPKLMPRVEPMVKSPPKKEQQINSPFAPKPKVKPPKVVPTARPKPSAAEIEKKLPAHFSWPLTKPKEKQPTSAPEPPKMPDVEWKSQ